MARSALVFFLALAVGYVLYLLLLFAQQRSMMFPGTSIPWDGVGQVLPPRAEHVVMPASFGHVQGVLLRAPATSEPAPAALYFHGNAEFVDQNIELLARVAELGLHVLLLEYPGYAGTDGRPSRASLNETARVGYDWLAAHDAVDATRIVAIGRSVGSGPAVDIGSEREISALILMAPFTAVADFARRMGAPSFLIRDRFDNRSAVARLAAPVLVMHGRHDGIIPFAHGQAIVAASGSGRLLALDCGHNDCPFFGAQAVSEIGAFLAEVGVLR